jgi:glycosyltransferase involved in cell wall biosynthesis
MKVLLLSRYPRGGASSRLRFYQYIPSLAARGIDVTTAPLFPEGYVEARYAGHRPHRATVLKWWGQRMRRLVSARSFDVLWVEGEFLPWCPAPVERLLRPSGVPYVADYDDAIFHGYDLHRSPAVRRLLGTKIDTVMRDAAVVVAGNGYVRDRALDAGARRVEVVPTVVDLARYPSRDAGPGEPFTIGWIGTPVTARFLNEIAASLLELVRSRDVRIVVVGSDFSYPGLPIVTRPWSEDTEAAEIATFDVGVMPLPDGPVERGKSGYKLIQYMASGLPVVASPVGVNADIVEHGQDGFLARTPQEWTESLLRLVDDPSLAREMGRRGRDKVEKEYCLSVTAPRLEGLLRDAADRRTAS